jgi:Ca2+-binding EF-hand superfamily protein
MYDANKDNLLDADELANLPPPAAAAAKSFDANTDGKLSREEISQGYDKLPVYRDALVQVRAGESGDALFGWLDAEPDGRLTAREMRSAAQRMLALDGDHDGLIAAAEIPDRVRCVVQRGDIAAYSRQPMMETVARPQAPKDAPRWLSAMDQNADGELSPREFLGTAEQFRQFDANADGFVSADEARQLSSSGVAEQQSATGGP